MLKHRRSKVFFFFSKGRIKRATGLKGLISCLGGSTIYVINFKSMYNIFLRPRNAKRIFEDLEYPCILCTNKAWNKYYSWSSNCLLKQKKILSDKTRIFLGTYQANIDINTYMFHLTKKPLILIEASKSCVPTCKITLAFVSLMSRGNMQTYTEKLWRQIHRMCSKWTEACFHTYNFTFIHNMSIETIQIQIDRTQHV